MRTSIVRRIGSVGIGLLTAALVLGGASLASAQISGASASTAGSTANNGNADGATTTSVAIQTNNGTTLATRFAWNVNADIGTGSTRDQSGSAQHNISLTANAPGSYQLAISNSRVGMVQRNSDIVGCEGQAHMSALSASTNVALNSGSLTTGMGAVDVNNGSGDSQTPVSQSTSGVIGPRLSNGANQSHTLTFTWSGSARSNSCEGAVRLGEGNGGTSGCEACNYPGIPSRTQSSDGNFVTITFTSFCGDGVINGTGEQCDAGANNGSATSCCTATCQFRTAGQTCRASNGECDPAETCPANPGTSGACPADAKSPNGTACTSDGNPCSLDQCNGSADACQHPAGNAGATCRAAANECDLAETCTGASTSCPADAVKSSSTACTSDGNPCTTDLCNGTPGAPACVHNAGNAGAICRATTGECDPQEVCTGASTSCPADFKSPSGTLCTDDGNVCTTDTCNGSSGLCQHPAGNAGTVCRASTGECDPLETCTGASSTCPVDARSPNGTSCSSDGNPCTLDQCNGVSALCQHPAGNAGATCRASAGACDLAETCDGSSTTCPADGKSTAECRPAAGVCDVAESCDGVNDNCPADGKSTAECRPVAGVCDVAESCDGVNDDCPADGFEPSTTLCRASAGVCDPAENCTGSSATCPADAKSTSECRAAVGNCDVAESCDGVNDNCPADVVVTVGTECRASAGDCDLAEVCDGVSGVCPGDVVKPSTVVCRPSAGICDAVENCTGSSPDCPADGYTSTSGAFVCRPAAGPCDVAEICDGSGIGCPADGKSTALCRAAAGVCDVAESCDGVNDNCPADGKSTAVCRPAVDQCDAAESCDGVNDNCPANGFVTDGTACNDGNSCTTPDTCTGGVCSGVNNADGCLDDFLCYKTKAGTPFTVIPGVNLKDTFQANANFDLIKVVHLCTPADKNAEGVHDSVTHQRSYKLKAVAGSPKYVKVTNIHTSNQLGQLHVDAVKPDLLFVPTAKSVVGPPGPLGPNIVDHYKCYKTVTTRGTAKFPKGVTVTVSDQFRTTPGLFDVKRLRHFCTPVNKNNEGVHNSDGYLLCYVTGPHKGTPKHVKRAPVYVDNQFGPATLATVKEDELCIPTLRLP